MNSSPEYSSNENISNILTQIGLTNCQQIDGSLQGSIWSASDTINKYVVKVTSRQLHKSSSIVVNGKQYYVQENIKKEAKILKHVTQQRDSPNTIIKFVDFFKCSNNYYLIMEHGGLNLFDFVRKAHNLIRFKKLDIDEWHKCVKVIFKQLIETVHYLHSKHVCHFDISLENILINDVEVQTDEKTEKIKFCTDSIQIKIIDFGLAEYFGDHGLNKKEANESIYKSSKFVGKDNYKSPEVIAKQKSFNAKANDVSCCGVCLFMMILGAAPFRKASMNDELFPHLVNNKLIHILDRWDRLHYVTKDIVDLLSKILKYENKRITSQEILKHSWMK